MVSLRTLSPFTTRSVGVAVTEIPEHLLQRSRERRAAMGGGDDAPAAGDTPAAASPATPAPAAAAPAMPAHPEPAAPEPEKPDSPMVKAAKTRHKIPFWAMPVIAVLPVWAYMFVGTLEAPPQETPQTVGTALYETNCASCHGAGGGGGIGPAFTSGAIFETWPSFEDHFEWVELGSDGWAAEHGPTYGATDKPATSGMPAFGDSLTDAQIVYIIMHERELGGENPDPEDHARLAAIADLMFADETLTLMGDEETGTPGAIELLDEKIASGEINLDDYAAE